MSSPPHTEPATLASTTNESAWHPRKDEDLFQEVGQKVEALRSGQPIVDKSADAGEEDAPQPVDEIESLCMNCHEQGTTRLMLTRIPFFREVVLTSFSCPHCGFKDSEIQSAGKIQSHGSRYTFHLTSLPDFSRQIIKSETCIAKFVELDVEIPAGRGQITNVESLLTTLIDDLEFSQPRRRALDPGVHAKIEEKLEMGRRMLAGEEWPVTIVLDDPAGNSSIQPSPDNRDKRWGRSEYVRSKEQDKLLALDAGPADGGTEAEGAGQEVDVKARLQQEMEDEIVPDEVYSFPATCPECTRHCSTHMKMVDIPHFKEVVIMSTVCEHCGYRSNEVKTGGAVPSRGRRITLRVEGAEDLGRDILKSESCAFSCEELQLSVQPGTLGGRFTTLEGILTQIRDDLSAQIFDMGDVGSAAARTAAMTGDSMATENKTAWQTFFDEIGRAIRAEKKFTVVLEDPLASSYVQNLCAPDADPQLTIEDYERTEEEMEDLGLNDIKTEGYEEDGADAAGVVTKPATDEAVKGAPDKAA